MRENEIIMRLKKANDGYVKTGRFCGDVSAEARIGAVSGQKPYAAIVTCSDSRVIPEAIFCAGVGELFVIRVAGNVVDATELASVEYAVHHLGVRTVVVLGHTHCGAVGAALHGEFDGKTGYITRKIKDAVGDEKDGFAASCKNALAGVKTIRDNFDITDLTVTAAIYDIDSGKVKFFE